MSSLKGLNRALMERWEGLTTATCLQHSFNKWLMLPPTFQRPFQNKTPPKDGVLNFTKL